MKVQQYFLFSDTQPSPAVGSAEETSAEQASTERPVGKQTSGNQASDDQASTEQEKVEPSCSDNVGADPDHMDSTRGANCDVTDHATSGLVNTDDISNHNVSTDKRNPDQGGIKAVMERSMQTENDKALLVPSLEVRKYAKSRNFLWLLLLLLLLLLL